ncbi:hypothetical protein, partial [Vibrio cholerae]
SWSMLADGINDKGITGRKWAGEGYTEQSIVNFDEIENSKFEITHFYKIYDIQYFSLNSYILKSLFRYDQLKIQSNNTAQVFYNRKELTRSERMAALQLILEKTVDDNTFSITPYKLSNLLYTERWYYHPDRERNYNYNVLLLDSLVASNDLIKEKYGYKLSCYAMVSLSQFEQDERKHKETLKQSKAMSWLTFVLIIVGLMQAYIAFTNG